MNKAGTRLALLSLESLVDIEIFSLTYSDDLHDARIGRRQEPVWIPKGLTNY